MSRWIGGKNASLGEMYREPAPRGVKVPNGFAITSGAYGWFLRETGLNKDIKQILEDLDARALAQAILYRGADFDVVWPQLAAIVGLGLVFFVVALLRFRASLAAQS